MRLRVVLLATVLVVLLQGCGGGGGGGSSFSLLKISVDWGARSRSLDGPSSALSVVVRFQGASETGADLLYVANRGADPSAHIETYPTGMKTKVGSHLVTATFFAQGSGTGSVVGVASGSLSVQPDGSLSGAITTQGTVASVTVPAGQAVGIDQTRQLQFNAKDSSGGIVAVSGGSAIWSVTSGADKLEFLDGYARGRAVGTASVSASVDGVASASVAVAVTVDSAISVEISPLSALVQPAESKQFSATVYGTSNQLVTWTVLTAGGGDISASGLYTAPLELMYVTIEARSVADPSKATTALVIVQMETLEVDVTPNPVTVGPNGQQQFAAWVIGSPNQAVTWKVLTSGGGSIDASGLYTAPATPMAVTLEARAVADPLVAGTSKVTVQAGTLVVTVSPGDVTLEQDTAQHFTAVVEGSPNQEVVWSVVETDGGTISAQGNYRAPLRYGLFTVKATSKADPSASGTAKVQVVFVSRIAFSRGLSTAGSLVVMRPDGSDVKSLGLGVMPAWSPDGKRIAFARDAQVWVMEADGTNQVKLTTGGINNDSPSWSPDGSKIVFRSQRDNWNSEIYVMNSDGTGQTRMTNSAESDRYPNWSPNGLWIAYLSGPEGGDTNVWIMNADGSNKHQLTNGTQCWLGSWSPTSMKLAYSSLEQEGGFAIYTIDSDGSNVHRVSIGDVFDLDPAWSPDGTKIAFRSEGSDISIMDLDGTNRRNLTNTAEAEWGPAWKPR
ncbi:MAG: PD40 domain-containing protein [Armatimonadetes bacterium]|nr:PD40 domain-containing protein [Armatimonadota bacterium]